MLQSYVRVSEIRKIECMRKQMSGEKSVSVRVLYVVLLCDAWYGRELNCSDVCCNFLIYHFNLSVTGCTAFVLHVPLL